MTNPSPDLEGAFRAHRGMLVGLCYRLTGSAADAEEIVQETFARAIERPPARTDEPWRPWLARVAVNLSLDSLRRRRRRAQPGSWLPTPIETRERGDLASREATSGETPETRYELAESVTFAFLLALEALTPRQRAVLVLVDVFDYSAREAGALVGTSEGNVRVVLHRARRAMHAYDHERCRPAPELSKRTRRALEELVRCLVGRDVEGLERILAADVRTVTDAGGEYTALHAPLGGRPAVARLYLQVAKRRVPGSRFGIREVNGLPGVLIEFGTTARRQAPCALICCDVDGAGRIRELYTVLGPRKLAAVLRL